MEFLDELDYSSNPQLSPPELSFLSARSSMVHSVREFDSSLGLFEHAKTLAANTIEPKAKDVYTRWAIIAARDGAMHIYHYGVAFSAARRFAFQANISKEAELSIRNAGRLFSRNFPSYVGIRDAISHSGEMISRPNRFERHKLREAIYDENGEVEAFAGTLITCWVRGSKFSITHEGRLVSFDINQSTSCLLREILRLFAPRMTLRTFGAPAGSV